MRAEDAIEQPREARGPDRVEAEAEQPVDHERESSRCDACVVTVQVLCGCRRLGHADGSASNPGPAGPGVRRKMRFTTRVTVVSTPTVPRRTASSASVATPAVERTMSEP